MRRTIGPRVSFSSVFAALALAIVGCDGTLVVNGADAGDRDAAPRDSAVLDADLDASRADVGPLDGAIDDDAAIVDDAALDDDAHVGDAGARDAGSDAGVRDAGRDAASRDAGPPGMGTVTARDRGTTAATYGFYEYLPAGYADDPTRRWPLIVQLSGVGEEGNGTTELSRVARNGVFRLHGEGRSFAAIVVAPQAFSHFLNAAQLDAFITYVVGAYRVDTDRISMTGLSAGAVTTWNYVGAYPDRLAAVAPISGNGNTARTSAGCALASTPLWAFHGAADAAPTAPDAEIGPVRYINSDCAPAERARITIYPGVGHNAWDRTWSGSGMGMEDAAYDPFDEDVWAWLLRHRL